MQAKRGKHVKEDTMAEATQRLYVPALGGIYSAVSEFAEPILRIGLGGILIPHGCQKLFGLFGGMGLTANAALFERLGYSPSTSRMPPMNSVQPTSVPQNMPGL